MWSVMLNKKIGAIKSALKNKKVLIVTGLILISLALAFSGLFTEPQNAHNSTTSADIGGQTFRLEVLNTNASRTQGLSGKSSLGDDEGALFDFEQSDDWRIWMKDMNFAIDIAWLNANKEIIHIKSSARPEDYPETYSADTPSKFVVELPANTFNNQGVKVGDTIQF